MRSTERARPSEGGYRHRAEGGRFRVASWNIRAAIGPGEPFPPGWWRHVRRERFARIAAHIRGLDADVIGLQEVAVLTPDGALTDQPAELAGLTDRHVRYAAVHAYRLVEPETQRAIGAATWGNAILSRTPVEAGFARGLPTGGDDALVEATGTADPLAGILYRDAPPGTREPRCVVGGRITIAGQPVWVVTTHLAYAGAEQRRAQAEALLEIAANRSGPLVLMGDLNAAIEDPEIAAVRAGLIDAFEAVGVVAGDQRRRTCGDMRIDHVLVRGLGVVECAVDASAGDASDHLPVVATLAVAAA